MLIWLQIFFLSFLKSNNMKLFSKLLLFVIGIFLIVISLFYGPDLVKDYGNVAYLLLSFGIMIVVVAPAYPENSAYFENFIPARANTFAGVMAVFLAVTILSMFVSMIGLLYSAHLHQEDQIRFFATSFAWSLLVGGGITMLCFILWIIDEVASLRRISRI